MKAKFAKPADSDSFDRQAMAKYRERMCGRLAAVLRPTRSGTTLEFFRGDGQDPVQKTITDLAAIGLISFILPAVRAVADATDPAKAGQTPRPANAIGPGALLRRKPNRANDGKAQNRSGADARLHTYCKPNELETNMTTSHVLKAGFVQRLICIVLAVSMATAPSLNVWAQNSGAETSARQAPKPANSAPTAAIDTTYVAPGAVALSCFGLRN